MTESRDIISVRFLRALNTTSVLFADKKRLVTEAPYVSHLFGVCSIVQRFSRDEDVWIAALLHDVIEDISPKIYGAKDIEREFGKRIVDLVRTVSHSAEPSFTFREARQVYLKQLNEGTDDACLISAADMVYNLTDAIESFDFAPLKAARVFKNERSKDRLWFYGERLSILRHRLGSEHELVVRLDSLLPIFHKLTS